MNSSLAHKINVNKMINISSKIWRRFLNNIGIYFYLELSCKNYFVKYMKTDIPGL